MDSSHDGAAGDSSKCSEMSVEEKRQLVYELSKQSSHLAPEVLQAWSRQEILQILCAEMGKERKYTGLTKVKIIETLMKIVSEKSSGECDDGTKKKKKRDSDCCLPVQRNSKRSRKVDNPTRYVANNNASGSCNSVTAKGEEEKTTTTYCNNLACRGVMRQEDSFCRRCSCCICRKYDENKDPSLWLTCSSDPPFEGGSCGFSCHLECAFESEKSGLAKQQSEEECCFYCVSCGKRNSLLECWKKQLTIAKEARRVDILCYRLLLVQKLIKGSSSKYRNLCEAVEKAVKSLEADVGPLTMKMGRGIVNRLNSGPDVQKLCSSALESLEVVASPSPRSLKMQHDCLSNEISADTATTVVAPTKIRFEDVNATSLTVILASNEVTSPANIVHYSIWHRKVTEKEYQEKSTCTLFTPNARFVVSGLAPASEYCFKVVSFSGTRELGVDVINVMTRSPDERSESPLTNCSTLSSVEAESNNGYIVPQNGKKDSPTTEENDAKRTREADVVQTEKNVEGAVLLEEEEEAVQDKNVAVTTTNGNSSPVTPFKSDQTKNRQARNKKSVKENGNNNGDHHSENGGAESGLEHCVKIIRQLECSGHIEKDFRQKFLTWYSLRATPQESRVVKIFMDTFADDPVALAEQLVHTFSDRVSMKRSAIGGGASAVVQSGFCMKLWH
ncbi:VIN3-like protein 2 [Raphanus sativus]|uniref:VIN3-like protein 2 n=1 Tax=Raphanus sativus TaxID=3726 RepID=A0A6J0KVN5_RAPSA|nr:VIN3-like protein 2 [Raphanus sativus]KAJ4880542.1 VIN3-like protein 2 [Raphanus sativus]